MARSSDSAFPLSLLRDRTFQAREIRRVVKLSALYLVVHDDPGGVCSTTRCSVG